MRTALLLAAALLSGCAHLQTTDRDAAAPAESLDAFFERAFQERLALDPIQQTYLGLKEGKDRWTVPSEYLSRRQLEMDQRHLAELRRYHPARLDADERLNYRLFEYRTRRSIEAYRWRYHDYLIEHRYGPHSNIPSLLMSRHSIDDLEDAEAYLERLRRVPEYLDAAVAHSRRAADLGVLPPRFVYPKIVETAANVISGRPFEDSDHANLLLDDFATKLDRLELAPGQREALIARAEALLLSAVGPAYRRLIDAMNELAERASDDDGVWKLPQGRDYYNHQLRWYTTTNLDADEIHELGVSEVARLQREMLDLMARIGFSGSLQKFLRFMGSAPELLYPDTDAGRAQYMADATAAIDNMRQQLDKLFTVKPRAGLEVRRVEAYREKSSGGAFYYRPAADGSRPGIYYVNLYDMASVPRTELHALAYHEGIPGHHMQIAIQQEMQDLPSFRRYGFVTAYSEGWALYAEWLPVEIDGYPDIASEFGRLSMELWRACRLVVDTGIHARGWTRAQAQDYLRRNTPNSESDIVDSIDRYIVWPGQATAYKIGMLKIQELRRKAEQALGERFDVRTFHDTVLENGPVPMEVLEELIDEYIAAAG